MIDFGIVLETTASILLPVVTAAAIIMFSGFHRSCSNIVSTFSRSNVCSSCMQIIFQSEAPEKAPPRCSLLRHVS